jgi:DNA-binding beta-propeller fold protein YncE
MNQTTTLNRGRSKFFAFAGCLVLVLSLALAVGCSNPLSSSPATELKGVVTTLAGSTTRGSSDGTGTAARLNRPRGVATDGTNVYVADSSNHMIRKIVISTGVVTTLAGSTASGHSDGTGTAASFKYPFGVATDGTNVYVADTNNYMIRKIVISTGVVTTLAGSTTGGHSDGTGTDASFNNPYGVATDGTNVYVADTLNHMIRKIVISTGVVTTLAGSTTYGSSDGTGTDASFQHPDGVATDGTNVYVADSYNHTIRKIVISTGVVTTLAGSTTYGSSDGTGTDASFHYPDGVATDGTNLYVADTYNNTIRKIVISTGVVTTLAGSTTYCGSSDGTGTNALFNYPEGVATDGTNVYVADYGNNMIREIQ